MRLRNAVTLISTILILHLLAPAATHIAQQKSGVSGYKADEISGDWNVSFELQGATVEGTFTLKLDGERLTGKVYSKHTGPGTLRDGHWADGELSFTADFEKHDSIAVTGRFKGGKLSGEFATEGMQGKWEATKDTGQGNS